jgi:hypothetical protein
MSNIQVKRFPRRCTLYGYGYVSKAVCHGIGWKDGRPFVLVEYENGDVLIQYVDELTQLKLE